MYLLNINRQGDVYKDDDGAVGVPEFQAVLKGKGLGQVALKWVALICDYDSPYRHYNESERVKAVSKDLYGKSVWTGSKNPLIQAAMQKYTALQFDPLDEQFIAFNNKVNEMTKYLNGTVIDDDNAESLQKMMIGIEKILKTRQTLIDAMERRGERKKIAGDKLLSVLERKKEMDESVK